MNTWVFTGFWPGANPLPEIWRTFQLIGQHDDLLLITVVILGTSAVLAILSRADCACMFAPR